MTELNPATEAEGTAVANIENPPPDDKGVMCDAVQIEGEQKRDVDEKMEIIEKVIYGKEEDEGKKDVNVKDSEGQEHEEEKKEGEVEDDGDKRKECEVDVGDKKEEGEVKENGDEKKVGEVQENGDEKKEGEEKENGDEKKEGKEMKDVEEKEDGLQNGITKLESKDGVKENMEDLNKEVEGAKMVDAEHVMANDSEDVKMVDTEDAKDEEKGGETGVQEGAQNKTEKDVNKEGDGGTIAEKVDEVEVADGSKKKRSRTKRASQKGEGKDKEGEKRAKELLVSPISSVERPVRERKTVERLVEVIEKEPNREFQVEKGHGTPLKDIPNVAYKLARKKPADIKLIHQTLFGRKGKAVNFKSHILQFSGFVWHESDEKQRAKMKEKLDKYVKDTLLDLCDLFDLPVSRANSRKEDLVTKLLDFLVAPHPTTDVILAVKDQKSRKRKRMARGGASKSRVGMPTKRSKKRTQNEDTPNAKDSSAQETENEDDDDDEKEEDLSDEKLHKHSEAEAMETESEEAADEDDDVDEYDEEKSGKRKQDKKKTIHAASKEKLKVGTSLKKSPPPTTTKSPVKRSSSKHSKDEENNDTNTKVFTSKKRNSDSPKKKSTPKSNTKEKTTDKKTSRGKSNVVEVEQPSKKELRKKICEILKEVDFNTATFTDILKQLATYYKMDLTPRKASLKLMIQEELTKLAEEVDEDEDDENDAVKEEKPKPKGKEVEA